MSATSDESLHLQLADRHAACTTLGPGTRYALWVQGCPFRCEGCVAPETLPFEGGTAITVRTLAREILDTDGVEGITFSGGEPFAQARALSELVDRVHEHRPDLTVVSFTGYTLDHLRRRGDDAQHALLDRVDLLIDGPYVASQHVPLRWRGSANQQLHRLTGRIAAPANDEPAGIQVVLDDVNGLRWIGVPPERGFRQRFEQAVARQGLSLLPVGSEESS